MESGECYDKGHGTLENKSSVPGKVGRSWPPSWGTLALHPRAELGLRMLPGRDGWMLTCALTTGPWLQSDFFFFFYVVLSLQVNQISLLGRFTLGKACRIRVSLEPSLQRLHPKSWHPECCQAWHPHSLIRRIQALPLAPRPWGCPLRIMRWCRWPARKGPSRWSLCRTWPQLSRSRNPGCLCRRT